jgi:hypothetical protein
MIRIDPPATDADKVVRFYVAHYGKEPWRVYKGFWWTGENGAEPSRKLVKELLFPCAPWEGEVTIIKLEAQGGFPILAPDLLLTTYSPEGVYLYTDWKRLREDKRWLLGEAARKESNGQDPGPIDNIVALLDSFQDAAADVLGIEGVFEHEAEVA